jgi:hypothetical protein
MCPVHAPSSHWPPAKDACSSKHDNPEVCLVHMTQQLTPLALPCRYQMDSAVLPDVTLQAAVDSCPGRKHAFFVSVTATGSAAKTLFRPCSSHAECGVNAKCTSFPGFLESLDDQDEDLREMLEKNFLFDRTLDAPGCAAKGSKIDPVRELKSFLLANFFDKGGAGPTDVSSAATFCGANTVLLRQPLQHWFPDCSASPDLSCAALGKWDGMYAACCICVPTHVRWRENLDALHTPRELVKWYFCSLTEP